MAVRCRFCRAVGQEPGAEGSGERRVPEAFSAASAGREVTDAASAPAAPHKICLRETMWGKTSVQNRDFTSDPSARAEGKRLPNANCVSIAGFPFFNSPEKVTRIRRCTFAPPSPIFLGLSCPRSLANLTASCRDGGVHHLPGRCTRRSSRLPVLASLVVCQYC